MGKLRTTSWRWSTRLASSPANTWPTSMVQQWEAIEIDIDGRAFWVRPVGSWVLESGSVVAEAMAVSLDKSLKMGRWFLLREHRT